MGVLPRMSGFVGGTGGASHYIVGRGRLQGRSKFFSLFFFSCSVCVNFPDVCIVVSQ